MKAVFYFRHNSFMFEGAIQLLIYEKETKDYYTTSAKTRVHKDSGNYYFATWEEANERQIKLAEQHLESLRRSIPRAERDIAVLKERTRPPLQTTG